MKVNVWFASELLYYYSLESYFIDKKPSSLCKIYGVIS